MFVLALGFTGFNPQSTEPKGRHGIIDTEQTALTHLTVGMRPRVCEEEQARDKMCFQFMPARNNFLPMGLTFSLSITYQQPIKEGTYQQIYLFIRSETSQKFHLKHYSFGDSNIFSETQCKVPMSPCKIQKALHWLVLCQLDTSQSLENRKP